MKLVLITAAMSFVLALGIGVVLKPWVDKFTGKIFLKPKG
jgi:hypothetical protein